MNGVKGIVLFSPSPFHQNIYRHILQRGIWIFEIVKDSLKVKNEPADSNNE